MKKTIVVVFSLTIALFFAMNSSVAAEWTKTDAEKYKAHLHKRIALAKDKELQAKDNLCEAIKTEDRETIMELYFQLISATGERCDAENSSHSLEIQELQQQVEELEKRLQ